LFVVVCYFFIDFSLLVSGNLNAAPIQQKLHLLLVNTLPKQPNIMI
jgi:hypothetical protein